MNKKPIVVIDMQPDFVKDPSDTIAQLLRGLPCLLTIDTHEKGE